MRKLSECQLACLFCITFLKWKIHLLFPWFVFLLDLVLRNLLCRIPNRTHPPFYSFSSLSCWSTTLDLWMTVKMEKLQKSVIQKQKRENLDYMHTLLFNTAALDFFCQLFGSSQNSTFTQKNWKMTPLNGLLIGVQSQQNEIEEGGGV